MIDLSKEQLIFLPEAARLCAAGRPGGPIHVSTLVRWIRRGVGGQRLEAVRLGGRWATSARALQRFAERLTAARDPEASAPRDRRGGHSEAAERRLDALGF